MVHLLSGASRLLRMEPTGIFTVCLMSTYSVTLSPQLNTVVELICVWLHPSTPLLPVDTTLEPLYLLTLLDVSVPERVVYGHGVFCQLL